MKYRTKEQWDEMCENMFNGNWRDAGQNAVDYGFYYADVARRWEEEEDPLITDPMDFACLIEIADEIRNKI